MTGPAAEEKKYSSVLTTFRETAKRLSQSIDEFAI